MSIAKITEISAASTKSFEDAIREGVKRASKTIKHLKSVWVKEQEAVIGDNGELTEFRVIMKLTFVVED
ncbi:dodecin family protein [Wenzhouxiangella sp. XN24]|uniref:dodecin family protein n=1 Tax=Wenzhouxiangella sp. XN24 TaxID=2713569 RepID=UPI0013EC6B64|nr:dodecin family protein [Wenzhouxiangella sp. XN24]NGX16126.1 dodecin domain-containing protein [Wenzhouxiangella sp. XN24]